MAKVFIPTPLRRLTNNQSQVQVKAESVGSLVRALEQEYPGFQTRLTDENGGIKRFINVFVNDAEIRTLEGLHTPLKDSDEVSIVPAMAGGAERVSKEQLLARTKAQIKETNVQSVRRRLEAGADLNVIDVREADEWRQGHVPGATFIPRGHLENRIEETVHDRDKPIVLYCAGGVRSAYAARTLQEMGYTHVESMIGGFGAWKNAGLPFETPREFTEDQRIRYSRQVIVPQIGEAGQTKLLDAKVLLIGAGGLGSPAALYLAAAGVGTIGVVDHDVVDLSNMHRQILHGTSDIGRLKVDSARDAVRKINPDVKVVPHPVLIDSSNALEIISQYDMVLNGSDNFPTRYLVNDACVLLGKPLVDASIFTFEGQVTVYDTVKGGPCYRCQYPDPPPPGEVPSCAEAGVLGVLPGIIGSIQAVEAIKLILGIGEPLIGRVLMYDSLDERFRTLKAQKNPDCPVCGTHPTVTELIDYEQFCGLPSRNGHEAQTQPVGAQLVHA